MTRYWLALAAVVLLAFVLSGLVLAFIAAVYGCLAVRAWRRRVTNRRCASARQRILDAVRDLAGDLRAGRPAGPAMSEAVAVLDAPDSAAVAPFRDLVARRLAAAWQVADSIGAPLAELLARLDAELRATETARVAAAAETAGARATGLLVAALPVGAIPVGMTLGVDPLETLLHSGIGAVCTCCAVALQCGGLAWTARLSRGGAA